MKPKKEVKPFTSYEILMNYERIIGRTDFNKFFTKENLAQAQVIEEINAEKHNKN